MSESHGCHSPAMACETHRNRPGSDEHPDAGVSGRSGGCEEARTLADLADTFEDFARARSISADQADQRRAAAEAREHRAAMRTWLSARRMLLGRTEEA